ncbi:MAG: hypothetical protein JNK19_07190 [Tabrizicola sp.]|nr:hypothetical protein [Tabrizicola sp.]
MRKSLVLVAALLAAPAVAKDLPDTAIAFGLWTGGAATDATGAYSHCYASLSYSNGESIWVNVTKDERVELVFVFPTLSLTPGQELDASLMMETGVPSYGKALAIDAKTVSFSLAPLHDAHVMLAQGNWIRLTGVGNDLAYEVRGLGGVLGLVRSCAEKQRG